MVIMSNSSIANWAEFLDSRSDPGLLGVYQEPTEPARRRTAAGMHVNLTIGDLLCAAQKMRNKTGDVAQLFILLDSTISASYADDKNGCRALGKLLGTKLKKLVAFKKKFKAGCASRKR